MSEVMVKLSRPCLLALSGLVALACSQPLPSVIAPTDPATGGARTPVGTSHPMMVLATHPQGRWVAACQAREDTNGDGKIDTEYESESTGVGWTDYIGDVLVPYLMAEGEELALDEFVATDSMHRYVAFVRSGKLQIYDTQERATVTDEIVPSRPGHRVDLDTMLFRSLAAFDESGDFFVYPASHEGITRLVVLNLRTEHEEWPELSHRLIANVTLQGHGTWLSYHTGDFPALTSVPEAQRPELLWWCRRPPRGHASNALPELDCEPGLRADV